MLAKCTLKSNLVRLDKTTPSGWCLEERVGAVLACLLAHGRWVCGGRTTDLLFCAIHCTHSDQSSDKEEKHAIA